MKRRISHILLLSIPIVGSSTTAAMNAPRLPGYRCVDRLAIVNADDFGMCAEENRATIQAFECGGITSATLMVPARGFEKAAEYARTRRLDVGVHLTLTSEWRRNRWAPVSGAPLQTLVDSQGYMWPTSTQVFAKVNVKQAEAELRAQLEQATAAGVDVTHVDSHMFILHRKREGFRRIYLELARDYRLPLRAARRALLLPISLGWMASKPLHLLRVVRRAFLLRAGFARLLPQLTKLGILCPDYLVAAGPPPSYEPEQYWQQVVQQLPAGVTEIYCHPAFQTAESADYLHDIFEREADLQFFASPSARALFEREEIRLISYRDLREKMRAALGGGDSLRRNAGSTVSPPACL
jgi:chitin disaccharide deacetylase